MYQNESSQLVIYHPVYSKAAENELRMAIKSLPSGGVHVIIYKYIFDKQKYSMGVHSEV